MLNIKIHTLTEDECGICEGWKQLLAGRALTQHMLRLPNPHHSGWMPCY